MNNKIKPIEKYKRKWKMKRFDTHNDEFWAYGIGAFVLYKAVTRATIYTIIPLDGDNIENIRLTIDSSIDSMVSIIDGLSPGVNDLIWMWNGSIKQISIRDSIAPKINGEQVFHGFIDEGYLKEV